VQVVGVELFWEAKNEKGKYYRPWDSVTAMGGGVEEKEGVLLRQREKSGLG